MLQSCSTASEDAVTAADTYVSENREAGLIESFGFSIVDLSVLRLPLRVMSAPLLSTC